MDFKEEMLKVRWAFTKIKAEMNGLAKDSYMTKKFEKDISLRLDRLENEIESIKSILEITKITEVTVPRKNILIGNNKSKKVHVPNCLYVKNISSENKVGFDKLEEAVKEGYKPCACLFEK